MDDISLRNRVDSLRFRGDIARTKLFIKMSDFIRKIPTATSANGNNFVCFPRDGLSTRIISRFRNNDPVTDFKLC
jgi:hypothetical protein